MLAQNRHFDNTLSFQALISGIRTLFQALNAKILIAKIDQVQAQKLREIIIACV
jgi:hypothetical protein